MKARTIVILLITHGIVGIAGFAIGIFVLPILVAPPAPTQSAVEEISAQASYTAEFRRDLQDSDALHWGEGQVSVSSTSITLMGELAPGPDYKLYLSPKYLETEAEFNRLKPDMVRVGDVRTFDNFIIEVPSHINPSDFTSVIVWCESFGQFITSAKYK
ncbi:MAG: DM13 domain-containing protein [Candidatus Thiodiazotropha lotti]|uniref:DM13 domain-containing protein n=1 Tax=Candidatus Thiodiazotropha endoloripes TaxID=1818881 RepID=A0A1E2UHQ6_9GAMM|nr:DM13 domain-containing protein [Candidatus Thiodiazotropha endoloripes]MCG7900308.1 DM13 domain-containing protein [Candidatus Thiodiazotropha weberae]MCG7993125.1 DM13 domain-containing protein [Candidatus Thiodiazotropha lotti]MCG7915420.1 DM13 domain-containing protein [Candidatus Thiodiazotropha weberae]MCG8000731.1 DM13 domain-containing protein [Candidatus Thiodiazotropha lotti]MCW4184787.1 DM13 domain-containing protein [Candidatus Thiodiazotropha weberae]